MNKSGRCKTLGLMVTNLYGQYADQLWPGIVAGLKDRGAKLLVFPGRTATWSDGFTYQQSSIYGKICGETVDALIILAGTYANFMTPEAYASFFDQYRAFRGVSIGLPLPNKTAITVDNRTGLEELIRHVVVEHRRRRPCMVTGPLTNEEARIRLETFRTCCQKLGLGLEPDQIFEGDFQTGSGKAAVQEIFSGTDKKRLPDALICANDNMAFGAMRELQERGFRIPADIIVTGFDDINEAQFSFPSLSTVSQPMEEQGYQSVLLAMDLCEGKSAPEEIALPTRMVLRSSCGCYSSHEQSYTLSLNRISSSDPETASLPSLAETFWTSIQESLPEKEKTPQTKAIVSAILRTALTGKEREKTITSLGSYLQNRIEQGQTVRHWISLISLMQIFMEKHKPNASDKRGTTLFLGSCLEVVVSMIRVEQGKNELALKDQITNVRTYLSFMGSALTIDEITEVTRSQLSKLGVDCFYIVTYDESIMRKRGEPWNEPDSARLVIGFRNNEDISRDLKRKVIRRNALLPAGALPLRVNSIITVNSLFFREEVIGYMMINLTSITRELYDIIVGHISSSLKTAALFQEREDSERKLREVLRDLEISNTQLQKISEHDELTGLYNRRGFLGLARRSKDLAQQMNRGGVVFFADLDGLKKINDEFGHKEGDLAIQSAALILKSAFRTMDILARLGGDEFTVLALDIDESFLPVIQKRMANLVHETNKSLDKAWKVSISLGFAAFRADENVLLEKLMTLADDALYAEKRKKRE